jgi:hypothetical protein
MHNMDSSNTKVMASLHRDTVNQRRTSQFTRAMQNPRAMDNRDTSQKAINNFTSMVNSRHMAVNPSSTL